MARVCKHRASNGNARRKLRARIKAEGRPCALCGRAIDYRLKAGDPLSYELDEIIPFSLGGSPIDYNNVQPAHRICNQRKSNKIIKQATEPAGGAGHKIKQVQSVSDW